MNEEYLDKYRQLIAQRKSSPLPDTEYSEKHHIKPRCICPEEDKNPDNIVRLSAYEHFIAHYYLMRIYEDTSYADKMVYAFRMMNARRTTHFTDEELHESALMYEEGKKRFSDAQTGKPSGMLGKRHTEESRKKMSDAQKGHPAFNKGKVGWMHHSDETKRKLSQLATGRKCSEEVRKKMSESRKGHPGWNKGKHHSEETKKKISDAVKKVPKTEEWNRKVSEAKMGKPRSAETCRKISESKKGKPGHPHSEESKAKISRANKGRHFSDEIRKRMSERRKGKPGHPCSEEQKRKLSILKSEFWRKWREQKMRENSTDNNRKE